MNKKLKQWDTTTHILEWPKSRMLITPNFGKDVEQQELPFLIGGYAKMVQATFQEHLAVSY